MARRKKTLFFEDLEVTGAGARGKAIAKAPDGRVVFISNAVPGDRVSVQILKKRKGYYQGKATQILQDSAYRIPAKCAHFGTCGGCKWQHMSYEAQLKYKEEEVVSNLQRIGKLELPEVSPIMAAPQQYYYRNKMEFSFSNTRWLEPEEIESNEAIADRNALGLHIPGMWDRVLDLSECHLQADPSNAIRLGVRDYAQKHNLPFFDPRRQEGFLRSLMIRNTREGEFMVLLQCYEDRKTEREGLLRYLAETFPQITSLFYTINPKGNDSIYDLDLICYHGASYITERMEGLEFRITPKAFYQTNSEQAYELYKVVRKFAGLSGRERVYDLYTGLGTIAQFLAGEAAEVIGIEAVPEAIDAAKSNAKRNGIENTQFFAGDMKNIFTAEFIGEHGQPDVLITDPPRDGMHKDVVARILQIAPERIVYVSCNSATQARDLALMKEHYHVKKIQPVDMFPQTHHVENVVLLTLRTES
jgi:23S rRNA (uracil1939-C5)-methyltransferase